MTKQSILCDWCEKERIIDSSYPHTFTWELSIIDTGINTSNSTYAVYQKPPFENNKHFCDAYCLKEWLNKNF